MSLIWTRIVGNCCINCFKSRIFGGEKFWGGKGWNRNLVLKLKLPLKFQYIFASLQPISLPKKSNNELPSLTQFNNRSFYKKKAPTKTYEADPKNNLNHLDSNNRSSQIQLHGKWFPSKFREKIIKLKEKSRK